MYDALYGRQSIEKVDSISVESQLEYCIYETHGGPYQTYIDRGFSGKNIHRPDFERMMADIRHGKINRVIVYKLDRISRSILDFSNTMEIFQTYHVDFVSCTEKFDTSTPIGRAMLNICIVFAQLERETIQKRVTDSYLSRCRRGFYMGGKLPYGYCLIPTLLEDIHTKRYEEISAEVLHIQLIYSMYSCMEHSLRNIADYMEGHNQYHLRRGIWSPARLSELLRNPCYVQADADVYDYFHRKGTDIANPPLEFDATHSCYLYHPQNSSPLLVLAPHHGIITSSVWLKCQLRFESSRTLTSTCNPKNSWLSGKVKCGRCGHAMVIRKSQTKWNRYFLCSQTQPPSRCTGSQCTIYAEALEQTILQSIAIKLSHLRLSPPPNVPEHVQELNQKKNQLAKLHIDISQMIEKVPDASPVLLEYINQAVIKLDHEKEGLIHDISSLLSHHNKPLNDRHISSPDILLSRITYSEKQMLVDIFIDYISIVDGIVHIFWSL